MFRTTESSTETDFAVEQKSVQDHGQQLNDESTKQLAKIFKK